MEEKHFDSLSTLLHENVHYIHSNGWKETKEELLHNIQSNKLSYQGVTIQESEVRIEGNTGIVTGKGTFNVSLDGKPMEIQLYYTEVYVITENGIRLMSRHACRM
ncbi:MAG: nuclear transport factor 2 family protein [Saprospiraceae bacterium]|nr:nuclear transport factor 2 family protein [Saprospiraceae bacterium]